MNLEEIKKAAAILGGLFPSQVTQQHVSQFRDDWKELSFVAVEKAIREHRRRPDLVNGFWDYGKLLEGCRAAERGEQLEARQYIGEQSFASIYRAQRKDLRDANDYEVVLRVHRSRANRATQNGSREISEADQRMIRSSCIGALISAGMENDLASRFAEYPFLTEVSDLKNWLGDVRLMTPPAQAKSQEIPEFAH